MKCCHFPKDHFGVPRWTFARSINRRQPLITNAQALSRGNTLAIPKYLCPIPSWRAIKNPQPQPRVFSMAHRPTDSSSPLRELATPTFYQNLREFWFGHIAEKEGLILPGEEASKRWWSKDPAFDQACV
jgi:hypothetical protein